MTDTDRVAELSHPGADDLQRDRRDAGSVAGGDRRGVVADVLLGLAVAAVLVAATEHFDLWTQGFRTIPTVGPLFLLDAIGGLVLAVVAVAWRHWLPVLAIIGFGASTVGAFYLSVTVGLFGTKEVLSGTPQLVCEIAEISAVVLGVLLLVARGRRPGQVRSVGTG
jgi:hypothetical protein